MNRSSNQDRVSTLGQAEPEPPLIKEESEEQCINQEEETLLPHQETDVKVEIISNCDETPKLCKNFKFEVKELLDHKHHPANIIRIPVEKQHEIGMSTLTVLTKNVVFYYETTGA